MIKMKRRTFLKLIGATAVGAVVPLPTAKSGVATRVPPDKGCDVKVPSNTCSSDAFDANNPAVVFRYICCSRLSVDDEWLDTNTWRQWAKYCRSHGLTMKGRVSMYDPGPNVFEETRTYYDILKGTAELGACRPILHDGRIHFYPSSGLSFLQAGPHGRAVDGDLPCGRYAISTGGDIVFVNNV